ncbi:hypothetical protein FB45DRAFT_886268, partial [Roridomyces roridus]
IEASIAQVHHLNAVRDPVSKLPLELSSNIFIHCLPSIPEACAKEAPMLLLNICTAWTTIALSTPALWACIYAKFPRCSAFEALLSRWFERAGNLPLRLSFHGQVDPLVVALVWRHSGRLECLSFSLIDIKVMREGSGPDSLMQLTHLTRAESAGPPNYLLSLSGTKPRGLLPSLQVLSIRGRQWTLPSRCSLSSVFQLLQICPNLTELYVQAYITRWGRLEGQHRACFSNLASVGILNWISAPRLESLLVGASGADANNDVLLGFLRRSSIPPIQELEVEAFGHWDVLSSLVPDVKRLRLDCPSSRTWTQFLTFFAEPSSSTRLQNLQTLVIDDDPRIIQVEPLDPRAGLALLLRALIARRTQLRTVRVTIANIFGEIESINILEFGPFEELLADGMDIRIGDAGSGENLLRLDVS